MLLEKINYKVHKWDGWVISSWMLSTGTTDVYQILLFFLPMGQCATTDTHYSTKIWPNRYDLTPGMHNILNKPLIDIAKILLPPLHIILWLVKQLVKALDSEAESFLYIRSMYPRQSIAKVKGWIFTGPPGRRMLMSDELELENDYIGDKFSVFMVDRVAVGLGIPIPIGMEIRFSLWASPYGSPLENFNILSFEARSADDKHATTTLQMLFGPHVITNWEPTI